MEHTTEASMIYLASCALHRQAPNKAELQGVDYEKLLRTSKYHAMASIVCMALETGELLQEPNMNKALAKQWTNEKNRTICKDMLFDQARSDLLAWMDGAGIWYMPLKGGILRDLYPQMGMREMADIDILFDAMYRYQVKYYMVSQGYEPTYVGIGNHDVYLKAPILNIELHVCLFNDQSNKAWFQYYEHVKKRLIKDGRDTYGYHFSDEDFYVYMMAHAFKHYDRSGTGLCSIMDCYVYLQAKGKSLDWQYIREELDKLGIAEFANAFQTLSDKLFSDPANYYSLDLSETEPAMLTYLTNSGTYGSISNYISKELQKIQGDDNPITRQTQIKYLLKRLLPGSESLKQSYPSLKCHPWCMPFYYVYRIMNGTLRKNKKVMAELRYLKTAGGNTKDE